MCLLPESLNKQATIMNWFRNIKRGGVSSFSQVEAFSILHQTTANLIVVFYSCLINYAQFDYWKKWLAMCDGIYINYTATRI